MNNNPARRAAGAVPRGSETFLRCDRGDALYVTNACAARGAFEQAGFLCEEAGGLLRLIPGGAITEALAGWLGPAQDALGMDGLRSREAEAEDLRLLGEGVKRWELAMDRPALSAYEKSVRQRAAVCLRTGKGGGTLWLCSRLYGICKEAMGL